MPHIVSKPQAVAEATKAAEAEASKAAAITGAPVVKVEHSDEGSQPEQSSAERQVWRFTKNWNTFQPITFKDGSTFQFQAPEFKTSDKDLAERLIAVADEYSIIQ